MQLHAKPFASIRNGTKTVELRLLDEKRQAIRVGDRICFTNRQTGERLLTEVIALHPFDSFAQLYAFMDLRACGYAEEELQHASYTDMDAYYSPELQKRYGVVGIRLALVAEP